MVTPISSHKKYSEDEDRYSRLMALEKMGVVKDYRSIQNKTIILIGVGGVGSSAAEMLVRCGIGKLIIFDYDQVEMANMNRLFYTPQHLGLSKVEVCKQALNSINPDVIIESFECNICYNYDLLLEKIRYGSIFKNTINLVLCCVDNYTARVTISQACNEANQCWMNSGVSENSISGQIQTCFPGHSACFQCAPPFIVATGGDEKSIKREFVCTASLPTTMVIIAGLLVQNALKFLLEFGKISWFQGYNCIEDYFPTYPIAPSPDCKDKWCILRQIERNLDELPPNLGKSISKSNNEEIIHDSNDWNIEIINDRNSDLDSSLAVQDKSSTYSLNTFTPPITTTTPFFESKKDSSDIKLEDISKQFDELMKS